MGQKSMQEIADSTQLPRQCVIPNSAKVTQHSENQHHVFIPWKSHYINARRFEKYPFINWKPIVLKPPPF